MKHTERDRTLDSHLFKSSQENLIDVWHGKHTLGCVWEGNCGENFQLLLFQKTTEGHLPPALSLMLKNKCTQPRTIWGPSFHFSVIPDCWKALLIFAGWFPFLVSFLLGARVKCWLRVLSVALGTCLLPCGGTETILHPGQRGSQHFWAEMLSKSLDEAEVAEFCSPPFPFGLKSHLLIGWGVKIRGSFCSPPHDL